MFRINLPIQAWVGANLARSYDLKNSSFIDSEGADRSIEQHSGLLTNCSWRLPPDSLLLISESPSLRAAHSQTPFPSVREGDATSRLWHCLTLKRDSVINIEAQVHRPSLIICTLSSLVKKRSSPIRKSRVAPTMHRCTCCVLHLFYALVRRADSVSNQKYTHVRSHIRAYLPKYPVKRAAPLSFMWNHNNSVGAEADL